MKLLITGATGNVGEEVISHLRRSSPGAQIAAAVRNIEKDQKQLQSYKVSLIQFDFTNPSTYTALHQFEVLFLLRPPQLSNVDKYFKPLLSIAREAGVRHIVFLSVQGVERSRFIPHHKIEALIRESGIPFTFLRPAYFMKNFTTTWQTDIAEKGRLFVPAGKARFTLIDVSDVGAVAAKILLDPEHHINQAYDLTNSERLSFSDMAKQLSTGLGHNIRFQSPGLLHFYLAKRKEKIPPGFIFVMMALHYLPRFQQQPAVTSWVKKITGVEPQTFKQFIARNKLLLTNP